MNIFTKIKLGWKAFTFFNSTVKEAQEMNEGKPGWKTTEFWLALMGTVGALISSLEGLIPAETAVMISAIITAVYTASRTIIKAVGDKKKPA